MKLNEILILMINSLLLPLVAWGLAELRKYLQAKITATQFKHFFNLAIESVNAGVSEVGNRYVDVLSESGEWTPEKWDAARDQAVEIAKESIGTYGMQILRDGMGSVDAFLRSKVDEAVDARRAQIPYREEVK